MSVTVVLFHARDECAITSCSVSICGFLTNRRISLL